MLRHPALLYRDHIRGPVHSIQLRPFLLFLFFSEPELCSRRFRFHPFHHVLFLFGSGVPVCPVPITSTAAGPRPPASAPPGATGYSADEQRQYGHGKAEWGWAHERNSRCGFFHFIIHSSAKVFYGRNILARRAKRGVWQESFFFFPALVLEIVLTWGLFCFVGLSTLNLKNILTELLKNLHKHPLGFKDD